MRDCNRFNSSHKPRKILNSAFGRTQTYLISRLAIKPNTFDNKKVIFSGQFETTTRSNRTRFHKRVDCD